MVAFAEALAAYRRKAADCFRKHLDTPHDSLNNCLSSKPPLASSKPSNIPFTRAFVPGLAEYLQNAACAFQRFKRTPILKKQQPKKASALGHGIPAFKLFPNRRKQRWHEARARERHRIRAVLRPHGNRDYVFATTIPKDILESAHQKFLTFLQTRKSSVTIKRMAWVLGRDEVNGLGLWLHREFVADFLIHVERCKNGIESGLKELSGRKRNAAEQRVDSFEEVKRRYLGKPDALYRRKTSRRYATWRRLQREETERSASQLQVAECEMKRRRGHDLMLSNRRTGDSSFAPFLFEANNQTFAFSSKISEAPKLRNAMLKKYSKVKEDGEKKSQWERAQEAAQTNPLFHTRVMNRFS